MNIFTICDIDDILLTHLNVINDYSSLILVNKYYHNKIINNKLYQLWIYLYDYDKKNKIKFIEKHESLFINACKINKLPKYLFLTFPDINIHAWDEAAFKRSCKFGHLEVAKWLIELGELSHDPVNIHADYEYAFRQSCHNDHLEVAKWLVELGELSRDPINIHVEDEYSFRGSCQNGARLYHALCA